ncbi:RNA polymerase II-associated protein 3 [Heracleum sosnowskyi]|uniref:RNA polymerase II-associated protein 3 n=1 Tax=Heracleum sosnowskyi TaxID=360622 RepID=A0AAD8JG03_9APIA|nr:RNA polymerase II-associated protein 3 [Heracleum sosnowskyi]
MAKIPPKHARDQNQNFQGFLNNLQDWESSLKDKDKKLKSQSLSKEKPKTEIVGGARKQIEKPAPNNSSTTQFDLRSYNAMDNVSSRFMAEGSPIDASSEKELGNENFKQKKYQEAIDCYSRSIAFLPTAVAYANRAMAYLKLRRFQEAEDDCTEALNLDDRYIKAYSRRSTARKELRKLKESVEDAEFALRLEPHNQEIKRQHAEIKSLYEKEILEKAAASLKSAEQGVQRTAKPVIEMSAQNDSLQTVSSASRNTGVAAMDVDRKKRNHKTGQEELKASVQELAARAATLATAEAAKNITPPTSAYQFEVSWHGLSGDRSLQARLLKVTSPVALPRIFKNSLSAPILIDIVRCIATIFNEEIAMSVKYLESLTKVSRFDIIIMCLPSTDKADLVKMWDHTFLNDGTPAEYAGVLSNLRSKYCPVKL